MKFEIYSGKRQHNCPHCEAEAEGYSSNWGFSPEGWEQMKEEHNKNHKRREVKWNTPI